MAGKPYRTRDKAWKFDFTNHLGKRDCIYLGVKFDLDSATVIQVLVGNLVSARLQGKEPSRADVAKVLSLTPKLRQSLIKKELIDPSKDETIPTLRQLLDEYRATRKAKSDRTQDYDKRIYAHFLEYFKPTIRIDKITRGESEKFIAWLMSERHEPLSKQTIYRIYGGFKKVFKFAVHAKYCTENPFDGSRIGTPFNPEKQEYIDESRIQKVLDACRDDPEFQLVIAMARYEAARINSDIRDLRFSDFVVDEDPPYIKIPMTGKTQYREIPLFDETRVYFEIVRALAARNQEFVFTKYRDYGSCSTALLRAIKKAGVKPWPRVFNNLRASCITDFETPGYTKTERDSVFGNSEGVRNGHYVIQEHIRTPLFKRMLASRRGKNPDDAPENFVGSKTVVETVVKFSDLLEKFDQKSNQFEDDFEQAAPHFNALLEDTSRLLDVSLDSSISPQDKMLYYQKFIRRTLENGKKIKQLGQVGRYCRWAGSGKYRQLAA